MTKPIKIKELLPKVQDLGKDKKVVTITSKFQLKQIVWKSGSIAWNIVLGIKENLEEAFINYQAKFIFDETPYLVRMETIEGQIEDTESDLTLFKKEQEREIKSLKEEICDIKAEMEIARSECPDIEFQATAIKIDWTQNDPSVTFAVDSELVEKLNRAKSKVEQYKIELTSVNKI